jgi:hypothetical protein
MTDNQYRVLLHYRDNDLKGNGILGRPLNISRNDLNFCVSRNWIDERKVGVAYIYKVSESGHKAIKEREEYLTSKCVSKMTA